MTVRRNRRLVVVGGGLAGLAAAVEARRAGLETCLVEQHVALRGPRHLLADFAASGAEAWLDTTAWGLWGRDLALCGPLGESSLLTFEQLIVATGAYPRPVAFPGWTVPGVLTLSAAVERFEQGVLPDERLVVAGYGVFATLAASELRRYGVRPLAILDASARAGRVVVRAEGNDHLERIVTARADADWFPRPATERTMELDTLVLAFGSLPEDGLARLAGCHLTGSAFLDPRIRRDGWMRTSVSGVLVAGDAGGVCGPEAAIEQGRLAGLAAAMGANCLSLTEAQRRARPVQRRLSRHTLEAPALESPRQGLFALSEPETVICRCEDVTAAEITERMFDGNLDPASVIAETRAGMGLCQARNCASLIAATIARHSGVPLDQIPSITPRPPIMPVPIGAIAERKPVFAALSELNAVR